jgi:hypothetical protein
LLEYDAEKSPPAQQIEKMEILHENIDRKLAISLLTRISVAIVGFILSPLSWWNDLFVNVPLSYAFAWIVGKCLNSFMVIHKWLFIEFFVLGYFLTNLIGFLMIHSSISGLKTSIPGLKRNQTASIKRQIAISIIYTLIIIAFFSSNICSPESGSNILPTWVNP